MKLTEQLQVFNGKRIFITGHTGFMGSWLSVWLNQLGAKVYGYGLPPPQGPTAYFLMDVKELLAKETTADIRDPEPLSRALRMAKPDVIFHLAAQPLAHESFAEPLDTFDVNVMGTATLLDAVRDLGKPCAVICLSSDTCYELTAPDKAYTEEDPVGGSAPLSASKAAMELLITSYRRSFFPTEKLKDHEIQLATIRTGNLIGGGDFSDEKVLVRLLDAVLVDQPLEVRNPNMIRPWQHVLEPLSGCLLLAAKMLSEPAATWSCAWNFAPGQAAERPVRDLVNGFIQNWKSGDWIDAATEGHRHLAPMPRLNCEKAKKLLGWEPCWDFDTAVQKTVEWYKLFSLEGDPAPLTRKQIEEYVSQAENGARA